MEKENGFLFEKSFSWDQIKLDVVFKGNEKERNVDSQLINNRMGKVLEKLRFCKDMPQYVYQIRSVFKDYDEVYLTVNFTDDIIKSTIIYEDKELKFYETDKEVQYGNGYYDIFHIFYEAGKGIQVNCDHMKDLSRSVSLTADFMKEVYRLKDVVPIELNRDSKLLCEIYQLFYDECPNFKDPDIRVKIQTMMFLLSEVGISLGEHYSFSMWSRGLPCSLDLGELIHSLMSYGVIEYIEDPIEIAKEAKQIIQGIGEIIRDSVQDKSQVTMMLRKISSVLYVRNYQVSLDASVDEISRHLDCSYCDVEESIQLVKKISDRFIKISS